MMATLGTLRPPERLVQQYFDGLNRGRIVDALNVFATDAIVRDESRHEHRGIREIAAWFARGTHVRVDPIAMDRRGDRVTAIVEAPGGGAARYREVFEVEGGRVRSLTVTRLRSRQTARRASVHAMPFGAP